MIDSLTENSANPKIMDLYLALFIENNPPSFPLTTLLWVSKGRNITRRGHGFQATGSIIRNNFYLIFRMFWSMDTSRSSIYWGQNDPIFNFKQVHCHFRLVEKLSNECFYHSFLAVFYFKCNLTDTNQN